MLLLTGPAGSGKSHVILEAFRESLRKNDPGVRLLVPTATMAHHLRNQIAREGFVFRPSLIQTLSRFIDPWTTDWPEVSNAVLYLLVERAVARVNRREFERAAHMPGFSAALARTVNECATAGLYSRNLARHLPATELGDAFTAVYREVERELAARGLALRAGRLERAAAAIEQSGLGDLHTIWMDGFVTLSDPELALVKAAARHAGITVTLPADDIAAAAREQLLAIALQKRACTHARPQPSRTLVAPSTLEREADEIARSILQQAARGKEFREIGIIVHNQDVYVPLLRAAFERFGIPARFYSGSILADHSTARFLAGVVDLMLSGWDHAETLAILKLAPGLGSSAAMDKFDFAVRAKLPGKGLETLRQFAGDDARLKRMVEGFARLNIWRTLSLPPAQWVERATELRVLYRISRPLEPATHEMTAVWRSQSAALDAFDAALADAARAFPIDAAPVSLHEFWNVVHTVMRLTTLRVGDERRNVVHVLSTSEARQWELPVVFVCGMVEGQFPAYHSQDAFLPDAVRRHLRQSGFRLRTTEDWASDEKFRFDSAASRATSDLILSYPRTNARGELNLPSLFLDKADIALPTPLVRPRPARSPALGRPSRILSDDLLPILVARHAKFSPSGLETFQQCPFQFFGRTTLKLEEPPLRPGKRLDPLLQGNIVHAVLAEWYLTREPIDPLFDRIFAKFANEKSIPGGYRTEVYRTRMRDDLRRFAEDRQWRTAFQTITEQKVEFSLDNGIVIKGRLDRVDSTEDGLGFVIDYKYSKLKKKLSDPNLLQGPLYLLAVEKVCGLKPAGMFYVRLRDEVKYEGWSQVTLDGIRADPFAREWVNAAEDKTLAAARQIVGGRILPEPYDLDRCRLCSFRDICRYEIQAAVAISEGA